MSPALPTRRAALRGVVVGAVGLALAPSLGACTSPSTPAPSPSAAALTVDEAARVRAAAVESTLAVQAAALARAATSASPPRPALAAEATRAAAAHAAHAAALREGLPAPTSSPSPSTSPTTAVTPGTAVQLAALQAAASRQHQSLLGPVSGDLARLLASVAASDAAFAVAIRVLA